jgi:hypothetical protein
MAADIYRAACHVAHMNKDFPADGNARAVMMARMAAAETEEPVRKAANRAEGGRKGAKVRTASLASQLVPQQQSEIGDAAAAARWKKS